MGVARTVYIRRAVSRVLSSSSLHATSCNLFGISTSSLFPLCPLFPPYLRIGNACLAPPVPVRHVRLMLSVSLPDTSVRCCPSLCPTRPSDAVRLPIRHFLLTLSVPVQHIRLTLSVSVSRSRSCSCSRSRSRSGSLPVPVPFPFPFPFPPPAYAPALACIPRTHLSTLENRYHYTRLHLLF